MIEIDKGILWPQTLAQLFPRDHFFWALQQRHQHLEWLHLQFHARSVAKQFGGAKVGLKIIKFVSGNSQYSITRVTHRSRDECPPALEFSIPASISFARR
jgi:hypothetical protein